MDNKKIAVAAATLFVLSMLPIWYLARYARPSGDDYGYSYLTHAAWLDTHSLTAVFRAGVQTVKHYYNTWNGDWFTTFLFSLMPEVFVPWSFWIVPLVMTGVLIAATSRFLYEVCVKIFGMERADFVIFDSMFCSPVFSIFPARQSVCIGMWVLCIISFLMRRLCWRWWQHGVFLKRVG